MTVDASSLLIQLVNYSIQSYFPQTYKAAGAPQAINPSLASICHQTGQSHCPIIAQAKAYQTLGTSAA